MNTAPRRRSSGMFMAVSVAAVLVLSCSIIGVQTTGAAPQAAAAPAGNTENGKRLFQAQACGTCHGDQGQGGLPNPEKEGAAPRIGPTRLSQPAFLAFVRNPIGRMPPYKSESVSDAEVADLYAFLQSLAPAPKADIASANSQNGQRLFTGYGCYECHGNEGQGSTQTGGSRIGPILSLGPGRNPLPPKAFRSSTSSLLEAAQRSITSARFATARIAVAPARPKW
jgi:mono/diheme cytochrome c family protein